MQRVVFIVEGPHDIEVVGRLLKRRSCKHVKAVDELDSYWARLVSGKRFPHQGDITKRIPVPAFFAGPEHAVAVHAAGGVPNVAPQLDALLLQLDTLPDAIGVVVDADTVGIAKRLHEIVSASDNLTSGLAPGEVSATSPRNGVYVLPDNTRDGALETLLLECADVAYPTLTAGARAWVSSLDPTDTTMFPSAADRSDIKKPMGKDKALLGTVANVLRPGKAIQVSLHDNRWLTDADCLALPSVVALSDFIAQVLGDVDAPSAESGTRSG